MVEMPQIPSERDHAVRRVEGREKNVLIVARDISVYLVGADAGTGKRAAFIDLIAIKEDELRSQNRPGYHGGRSIELSGKTQLTHLGYMVSTSDAERMRNDAADSASRASSAATTRQLLNMHILKQKSSVPNYPEAHEELVAKIEKMEKGVTEFETLKNADVGNADILKTTIAILNQIQRIAFADEPKPFDPQSFREQFLLQAEEKEQIISRLVANAEAEKQKQIPRTEEPTLTPARKAATPTVDRETTAPKIVGALGSDTPLASSSREQAPQQVTKPQLQTNSTAARLQGTAATEATRPTIGPIKKSPAQIAREQAAIAALSPERIRRKQQLRRRTLLLTGALAFGAAAAGVIWGREGDQQEATLPPVSSPSPERANSAAEILVASEQSAWRQLLGKDIEVTAPPEEMLQTMQYAKEVGLGGLVPHFIPNLSVSENDNYPGWSKKPGYDFWQYIPGGNFQGMDSLRYDGKLDSSLTQKWILIDPNISGVGQYSHAELYKTELPRIANQLHVSKKQVRLSTALEHNVLGNIYYPTWDDSSQREWLHEASTFDKGSAYPQEHAFATGGSFIDKTGGLDHVDLLGDMKHDNVGFRPMVVFSA